MCKGGEAGYEVSPTCLEAAKGKKRPADVIGNAVHVMRIATGETEEDLENPQR
jgi:hypothetical protein